MTSDEIPTDGFTRAQATRLWRLMYPDPEEAAAALAALDRRLLQERLDAEEPPP